MDYNNSETQRERLLAANERLEKSTKKLINAGKVAEETTYVGNDILDELGQQRETIISIGRELTDADHNVDQSTSHLNSMQRQIKTNKCILAGIILLLVAIVIIIILIIVKNQQLLI